MYLGGQKGAAKTHIGVPIGVLRPSSILHFITLLTWTAREPFRIGLNDETLQLTGCPTQTFHGGRYCLGQRETVLNIPFHAFHIVDSRSSKLHLDNSKFMRTPLSDSLRPKHKVCIQKINGMAIFAAINCELEKRMKGIVPITIDLLVTGDMP